MEIIKNYATRPSALPLMTYIPAKIPWAVLRASDAINEVHPFEKAVPADQGIRSLGTSMETFKGEALTTKEEGFAEANDAGVQSYFWDRWVMVLYPLLLPHKAKIYLEGLRVICFR